MRCMYYVSTMYFFGAHVHSNVFRRPIRAQGLSWYSVKTQGPSQYTPQSAMSVVWKDPCSCIYAVIAVILNAPEGHASAITSNKPQGKQRKPI